MAKLKAYGQHEVARFARERETPADNLISRERVIYAVMSNGRVLWKRDVTFRDDGRRHDYGWKVARAAGFASGKVDTIAQGLLAKGFVAVPHHGKWGLEPAYQVEVAP